MGRHASGWKIRQRSPSAPFSVRFTWHGEEKEFSCATTNRPEAAAKAALIYAAWVSKPAPPGKRGSSSALLEDLLAAWLTDFSASHAEVTVKQTKMYCEAHFLPFFRSLPELNDASAQRYMLARLRKVQALTVRQELMALRSFCAWLEAEGHHGAVTVPRVPPKALGVKHPKPGRVAAPELSPSEIAGFLAALPEWSTGVDGERYAVRAFFVVLYETGLRPTLLKRLRTPEHYVVGADSILITPEIDKIRFARRVPLTQAARAALDAVVPLRSPTQGDHIFAAVHSYRYQYKKAALAAMPPWKARIFAAAHARSARITHLLELTDNVAGVQQLVGHKHVSTTARYVRASERAARAVVVLVDSREAKEK